MVVTDIELVLVVEQVPAGFAVAGRTGTCAVAAMADPQRRLYGVQFHPEVVHTANGRKILENFLFRICGCTPDWDPKQSAVSRRKFFASVADTDTLILPIHFPSPTVGLIKPFGSDFDYRFKRE